MKHSKHFKAVFIDELKLLGLCVAIYALCFYLGGFKNTSTTFRFEGTGMALCQTKGAPGEGNGAITLEFKELKNIDHKTFQFTLNDGSKVTGILPCMVEFDTKAS